MLRALSLLVAGVCAAALVVPAFAHSPADVTLTRVDCGTGATPTDVAQRFSDTFAYKDLTLTFTFSCYVIEHDDEYMVWDTGDHTGQLTPFTNATLLIGKGDWDQISSPTPMPGANVAGLKSWIDENRTVEPLAVDTDVFGDGSVVVLRTPGHTPGHSSLLVRLKRMGPVLLTGDAAHFRENYESGRVPWFNFDRAATIASIERMKQIAANPKATVIIQHDSRDIGKPRAFPVAAN